MKYIFLLLSLALLIQGCSECETLTANLENDELPTNPDPSCTGTFYASFVTINNDGFFENRSFVSFPSPKSNPFAYTELDQLSGSNFQDEGQQGYNHSAYNINTNRYAFAYQYGPGITNPLYLADTNPFAASLLTNEFQYAAPVYNNNLLYAIDVLGGGDTIDFSILTVNQTTGDTTILLSDFTNTNSPIVNRFISSATDGADMIYFLGTTNLISYSISANTATVVDIDLAYTPTNQLVYYGLEYQQDEQRLLAIKERINSSELIGELVSITTDGAGTATPIYDIQNNLNADNDGTIFFEFNATAFSQCNNTYHIAELNELEPTDDIVKSNLIAINLSDNSITEQQVEGYFYGLEIDEN